MLGSAFLSSSKHAGSSSTCFGPLELLAGVFIHPLLFTNGLKAKVSDQVNLLEELFNQQILVVNSLGELVNS